MHTNEIEPADVEDELMTPEHRAEIEKIRASSATKALDIIRVIMPRKVIELTELMAVRSILSCALYSFQKCLWDVMMDFK